MFNRARKACNILVSKGAGMQICAILDKEIECSSVTFIYPRPSDPAAETFFVTSNYAPQLIDMMKVSNWEAFVLQAYTASVWTWIQEDLLNDFDDFLVEAHEFACQVVDREHRTDEYSQAFSSLHKTCESLQRFVSDSEAQRRETADNEIA